MAITRFLSIFAVFALFLVSNAFGQSRTFKLKILDETGQALPFAHIQIENEFGGAISNGQGLAILTISNPETKYILVSYLGYVTQKIAISDLNAAEENLIILREDEILLSELQVIDIGEDPNEFMLSALSKLYNSYPKRPFQTSQVYSETVIENGATTFNAAAEVWVNNGLLNRNKKGVTGKNKDENFLYQTKFAEGLPKFEMHKDIPVLANVQAFFNSDDKAFSLANYYINYSLMRTWIEDLLYNQEKLSSTDWIITKMQDIKDDKLIVLENKNRFQIPPYPTVHVRFVCSLKERKILYAYFEFEKEKKLVQLPKEIPEFQNREEYLKWSSENSIMPKIASLFYGSGQAIIHFYNEGDISIPKNFFLFSNMEFPTFEDSTLIQLQIQQNLNTVNLKSDFDTSTLIDMGKVTRSNPWWKQSMK